VHRPARYASGVGGSGTGTSGDSDDTLSDMMCSAAAASFWFCGCVARPLCMSDTGASMSSRMLSPPWSEKMVRWSSSQEGH